MDAAQTINLCLLGVPKGSVDGREFRLHSRRAWGVLASLALSPRPISREALRCRFFAPFELEAGAKGLNQTLTSIRKELDCVDQRDVTVKLLHRERFRTDLEDLSRLVMEAETISDPEERLPILDRACRLYRGEFLENLDEEEDEMGWVFGQRLRMRARASEAYLAYARTLETLGDFRAAFDAGEEAFALLESNEPALQLLFRVGNRGGRKYEAEIIRQQASFDEAVKRVRRHEFDRASLSLRESVAFEGILGRHLQAQSSAARSAVFRLSVFPGSFTAEQARSVSQVDAKMTAKLLSTGLLQSQGERFSLGPIVRGCLWGLVSNHRRFELEAAFVDHFVAWVHALHADYVARPNEEAPTELIDEIENLDHAVSLVSPMPEVDVRVLDLGDVFSDFEAAIPLVIRSRLGDLCRTVYNLVDAPTAIKGHAAYGAARIHYPGPDFPEAIAWFDRCLEIPSLIPRGKIYAELAFACHHAARPSEALSWNDQAIKTAEASEQNVQLAKALSFRVEILVSAGRVDDAILSGHRALDILEAMDANALTVAESLYQLAGVYGKAGRMDRSVDHLTRSLAIRLKLDSRHGVGDCLRRFADIKLKEGSTVEAMVLLRYATDLYASLGKDASRAAALGQTGDVYQALGENESARAAYEESLSYWRSQGHAGWIESTIEKLRAADVTSVASTG